MNKFHRLGLLVALTLGLAVPAVFAQFDPYLGGNPNVNVGVTVDSSGVAIDVNASLGGSSGSSTTAGNVGSRTTADYRATVQDSNGQNPMEQSYTTNTTQQGSNAQYEHVGFDSPTGNTWTEAPARNQSAKSAQWDTQQMLESTMGAGYDKASTELLAPQSFNQQPIPSAQFNLGFPTNLPFEGPQAPWVPGPTLDLIPPTSTSSCDFNVVDL